MTTLPEDELHLVGTSLATRQLDSQIAVAARADAKVLITGDTGVGKDIVARLLHRRSARAAAPFAVINCAGLPDTLLESELFGHLRGSFTGAFRDKVGQLEAADGGTVFLDEAGEMSTRMQGVLLRFLETGEVQRVGSERAARRVNVRIIAATNRDLSQQIAAGAFREDLYYRLNVIRMHVPPLRERLDDVAELFDHFMAVFGRQYRVEPRALTPEADAVLRRHRWPGNVRELKNVVEQLVVKDRGQPVLPADLPSEYRDAGGVLSFSPGAQRGDDDRWSTEQLVGRMTEGGESFWSVLHGPFMARDLSRDQLRHVIRAGLEQTGGNYRVLVELFNMPATDYKRFLGFLRKHDCQVPFHPFRSVRHRRGGLGEPQVVFPSAASM